MKKDEAILEFLKKDCKFDFNEEELIEVKKYIQDIVADLDIFDRYIFDKERDEKDALKSIEFLVSLIEGENVERKS
jgi:hypothetical protein